MRYLQEISVTEKIACHEIIYGTINGIALEEASAVQHVFWFNIFLALNLGSTCKTNVKKMYTDFFVLKVKIELVLYQAELDTSFSSTTSLIW